MQPDMRRKSAPDWLVARHATKDRVSMAQVCLATSSDRVRYYFTWCHLLKRATAPFSFNDYSSIFTTKFGDKLSSDIV